MFFCIFAKITIMKKFILSALLLVFCSLSYAKDIKAILSYASFVSPVDGPYLETYLSVDGKSVNFVQLENGKFQASIEITLIFKDKDEIIKDFKKYYLLSPELEDSNDVSFTFIAVSYTHLTLPTKRIV